MVSHFIQHNIIIRFLSLVELLWTISFSADTTLFQLWMQNKQNYSQTVTDHNTELCTVELGGSN